MAEFKNPNQPGAPQGNQSLLVMMVVLVTVFFAAQYYKAKHNPQTASPNAASQGTPQNVPSPSGFVQPNNAPQPGTPAAAAANAGAIAAVQASAEASTVVENELYRITFSNRGAQVTSWILKAYKDNYGKPLDLVHEQAAKEFGYPLSIYTYDSGLTASLRQAMFVPSATGTISSPTSLTFNFSNGDYAVKKTFSFDETYVLHAGVEVTRNGAPIRALLAWPGGFGDIENAKDYALTTIDVSRSGKEDHLAGKKVSGGGTLDGPFDWAGVSDQYFAAIFLPDSPRTATVATLHNEITVDKVARKNGVGQGSQVSGDNKGTVQVPLLGAAIGDVNGPAMTRIYAGPKAVNILKNVHAANPDVTLEPLLDFGFFGIIGKLLFLALQWVHAHVVSNWGWAIVILTIAINAIILPLRVKTMQSGLKMQRIQPQMDAIKAKYKSLKVTDPKRNEMNAEIMQLQKDNGVNMFGGCIPTLIQLPLLFAFLGMLPKVVELRQAHWGWLPDLSAADPYHILPILMIVSQFLVQFYTPSPGVDPQQQKMMAFMMPAFSGYITWNYASGLALYWAVGNLIGIAQQAIMNRTSLGREARELAAKRARRKSGQPPTLQGKAVRR
ncbi:membrane protein insertase YidC [Granulicella sibirica]|uniref:Membrane protein insertase YidC n=1 Tax=Granulicella sibirica TaxID=2479048 RepID=A0A4Q0T9N3_9BACT|nr:membrane protein insertase YidC [Granulicella sibirica]RXH58466.1 Inner membrane protein translocase component YidC, long form [Granulicella sibirica]